MSSNLTCQQLSCDYNCVYPEGSASPVCVSEFIYEFCYTWRPMAFVICGFWFLLPLVGFLISRAAFAVNPSFYMVLCDLMISSSILWMINSITCLVTGSPDTLADILIITYSSMLYFIVATLYLLIDKCGCCSPENEPSRIKSIWKSEFSKHKKMDAQVDLIRRTPPLLTLYRCHKDDSITYETKIEDVEYTSWSNVDYNLVVPDTKFYRLKVVNEVRLTPELKMKMIDMCNKRTTELSSGQWMNVKASVPTLEELYVYSKGGKKYRDYFASTTHKVLYYVCFFLGLASFYESIFCAFYGEGVIYVEKHISSKSDLNNSYKEADKNIEPPMLDLDIQTI